MSRTETALNPLVENKSSAAHRMASRRFALRGVASSLSVGRALLICTNVQIIRSSQRISAHKPPVSRMPRLLAYGRRAVSRLAGPPTSPKAFRPQDLTGATPHELVNQI